ncbi:chemotaxis protein CheA [bacterium]|nr:chemotaxis protein CheA [bacterium]
MTPGDKKYVQFFFSEAEELLVNLNNQLIELEKDYSNREAINEIFRITHTIKGNAAAVGFGIISSVAHALEDVFDAIRRGVLSLTPEISPIVFDALDALAKTINYAQKTGKEPSQEPEIVRTLRQIAGGEKAVSVPESKKAKEIPKRPKARPTQREIKISDTIRVRLSQLDDMLNLLGEILIRINQLENISRRLNSRELSDTVMAIRRAVSDIQFTMMNVRLMSLSSILSQLPRLVHDIARDEGKKAALVTEGEDIELDSKVIEKLKTPIVQIIRNAVAHGIEPPEIRKKMGKPKEGIIKITATRHKGRVLIDISDDGAGIDPVRIAGKAVEMGLITEQQANEFSDEQLFELIFEPGFTTAEKATKDAGRGAGLDAVRDEISSIGGNIFVKSQRNRGTTFTIDVPLSIAVIKALLCNVAGKNVAIPSSLIDKLIYANHDQIKQVSGKPHFLWEDDLVPVYDIGEVIYNTPSQTDETVNLILCRLGSRSVALQVERFSRETEVVVKTFWSPWEIRTVSGATILGDGSLALILDPFETIKLASIRH